MQSCATDRDRGYLDVAIAKEKICKTQKKIRKFVSETCGNWWREYLVSESWGAPFIFGQIQSCFTGDTYSDPSPYRDWFM